MSDMEQLTRKVAWVLIISFIFTALWSAVGSLPFTLKSMGIVTALVIAALLIAKCDKKEDES